MFVFCDKCYNHYDDSYQRSRCKGPGGPKHIPFTSKPIDEHVAKTRSALGESTRNPASATRNVGKRRR